MRTRPLSTEGMVPGDAAAAAWPPAPPGVAGAGSLWAPTGSSAWVGGDPGPVVPLHPSQAHRARGKRMAVAGDRVIAAPHGRDLIRSTSTEPYQCTAAQEKLSGAQRLVR